MGVTAEMDTEVEKKVRERPVVSKRDEVKHIPPAPGGIYSLPPSEHLVSFVYREKNFLDDRRGIPSERKITFTKEFIVHLPLAPSPAVSLDKNVRFSYSKHYFFGEIIVWIIETRVRGQDTQVRFLGPYRGVEKVKKDPYLDSLKEYLAQKARPLE